MRRYVVGFMFNDGMDKVVMIRKNRPAWQSGLLNGVGGKIQPGEVPLQAMVREFKEEAGIETDPFAWAHVLTLRFPYAEIEFFAMNGGVVDFSEVKTCTDEPIERVSVEGIQDCIENIPFLLALSKQRLVDREL